MGEWVKSGVTNMVRRGGGMYYAQVKVKGKTYRRSLGSKKRDIARIKLSGVIDEIRKDAGGVGPVVGLDELEGCVVVWLSKQENRPDLKPSTKSYNKRRAAVIRETLPMRQKDLADVVFEDWWRDLVARYNTTFSNNLLCTVRRLVDMQVEAGVRVGNPLHSFKRVKQKREIKRLPNSDQFKAMVDNVRAQRKASSEEVADMIEWAAYTGLRPAELRALEWVDVGADFLTVRGGEHGTKNMRERLVPIMASLVPVIERRRQAAGPVFYIKSPREALDNVCDRLELPHLRVYDLRHIFATRCIESGVDFATVALWLGHSDGGALAARVYGHVSNAHGLAQAKRVAF